MLPVVSSRRCSLPAWTACSLVALLAACGGTGTPNDSGTQKTYLSVEATDGDGDALQYQWRVTAGSIDNRNARQTVWTLPDGPGLHFAYVSVSDGKGGRIEQQYAVSSDTLGTTAPARPAVSYAPRPFVASASQAEGLLQRLRFQYDVDGELTRFVLPADPAASAARVVYLPDVQATVVKIKPATPNVVVYTGSSDLAGELSLPALPPLGAGETYGLQCSNSPDAPLADCGQLPVAAPAIVRKVFPTFRPEQNLRLYGHVALADGSTCGDRSEFFGLQNSATIELRLADGTALTSPIHVNRFGDYAIAAPVPIHGSLQLKVRCEGYETLLAVPAPRNAMAGYVSTAPLELTHTIPNHRPQLTKMVATGPDGNVRGKMIVAEVAASSNALTGANRFLAYKGQDTRRSACAYYVSLGAASGCDAQGGMVDPISFEDWKRGNKFAPYAGTNTEVQATYINQRDLNLVRRMVATKLDDQHIAFYVCNHPGPEGTSQREIDEVLAVALADQKRVACVAMEWTPSPGANGDAPLTKFFTFGPDGSLLNSINLDGRGEKYMPGTCVACHGGGSYNGRFPEVPGASPSLGARFLPFDTGNYHFSSDTALGEAAQSGAFHELNALVSATEGSTPTATTRLIGGWYPGGSTQLDKQFVPASWQALDATAGFAGASRFYREVVGTSCRTCHTSLGEQFDWDANADKFKTLDLAGAHFCGGTANLAINATMPNALISRDRLFDRVRSDASLADLLTKFLGCTSPLPDPAYPQR